MSFWDTVLGHNLAETLIRNLPKIAKSLNHISEPNNRNQHASVVNKRDVADHLNSEFSNGRVFISATPLDFESVLVITE